MRSTLNNAAPLLTCQQVLYVEDDVAVRTSLAQTLQIAGFTVQACANAEAALPFLQANYPGVLLTDVQLPKMSGIDLLAHAQSLDATLPVILVTAHGDIDMAVQAMRAGAYDFIEKPFAPERLVEVVARALEKRSLTLTVQHLKEQLERQQAKHGVAAVLLGHSPAINALRTQIELLANTDADVLVHGETGTGKELVARCLHEFSQRRTQQFVALNCGALPETLLESELFGHEAGAFTTAQKKRIGKIEFAHQGTLFLDEIESMAHAFQVRLLRVLQERSIERLGSNQSIPVNVRVIAATKTNLLTLSQQDRFRNDLYYRLSVVELHIPPLRERREDIPLLFEHFCLEAAARYQRAVLTPSFTQIQKLMSHDWPGNVRELRNMAERFVLGLLPESFSVAPIAPPTPALSLSQQMDAVEKMLIEQVLRQFAGRPQQVIEALGIGRKTFYDKVHKHGIRLEDFRCAHDDSGLPAGS